MKIAIIGGGVCGLFSGLFLAKAGFKVSIFEKNEKLAKKLLITGNGRCNITNGNIALNSYHSQHIEFFKNFFKEFDFYKIKKILNEAGIEITKLKNSNRYFPLSFQAKSIVNILIEQLKSLDVEITLNKLVTKIEKKDNFYIVNNKKFDIVIIATGSLAKSQVGGSKDAYIIAKNLNLKLTKIYPSLVQLISNDKITILNGVRCESNVRLFIDNKEVVSKNGEVLFTKYGLSGDVILDISRLVSVNLDKNIFVLIDLLPSISNQELFNILKNRLNNFDSKLILTTIINEKIAKFILKELILGNKKLNLKDIKKIAYFIKNFKININDTKGFEFAEVVNGGIDIGEIKKNFELKKYKNIFICGEVLDIDGDCGGYNIHFAIANSFVISNYIKEKMT